MNLENYHNETAENKQKSEPCNCCCLETLYTILDGEASDEKTAEMMVHLEKCLPCYQQYDLEVAIRELLQTRLAKKCPPQDLLDCIREKIATITITQ
jgi:anti-sigma factor (TIGR02949 family)